MHRLIDVFDFVFKTIINHSIVDCAGHVTALSCSTNTLNYTLSTQNRSTK